VSLGQAIAGVLAVDPGQPALEYERTWWSWGELARRAAGIAGALRDAGLAPGTRIGVMLRNRPQMVPVLIALLGEGYCLATVNGAAPDAKLAEDIEKLGAPTILALESDWQRPGLATAAAAGGSIGLALTDDGERPVEPVAALPGDRSRWRHPRAEGIAIEMLSSGTTGTPKRIPLKAVSLEKALQSAAAFEKGRKQGDPPKLRSGVQIVNGPLAHISGITGVMNNILAGRRICLLEKFTVEGFRDALVRHRPKVATAPPAALRMLLDADLPAEDLASVVALRTGTAPLDPETADIFFERYGIPVLQNYGATEFAGGAAGWTLDDFKAHWQDKRGSVGRLNKGVSGRVIDPETEAELPPGSVGLLEIRAPNIGDGQSWVRTTDLAVVDADRFLWIKGRADGAIMRGGFKVLPEDVLKAVESHPAVREAAVVALDDPRLGQVPVAAWIARTDAADVDEAGMRDFLKARLMPYQVPVRTLRLDEFPRTPSMKVSQPALRELIAAAVGEKR
jgi:acyl-CoA synthetase (AMP-forming)/AMP-acid ligase II